MNYRTFLPHTDLQALVKCFWSLEIPAEAEPPPQRIIPDGCMEMIFILGEDIMRYPSQGDPIIQGRAIIIGQITEPFVIRPTGAVHCFGIRFYPYGVANFVKVPLKELENKETPINEVFERSAANALEQRIIAAGSTEERIGITEGFLFDMFDDKAVTDQIVRSTIDTLMASKGNGAIGSILKDEPSKRRQMERNFSKQVGLSPKQLGKIIRLQTALKLLLDGRSEQLTRIAYESEYYDQAHFIKDFKSFTGINPKDFLEDKTMSLSTAFYSNG